MRSEELAAAIASGERLRRGLRRLDAALSNDLLKDCDAAENLHGWRPPSGALLVQEIITFAGMPA